MKKIKILILSDINTSTEKIVKNGLNLAKILDGEIDFFCVKKPTDIVKKESQLSVMRTINEKFLEADTQIKKSFAKKPLISFQVKSDTVTDQNKDSKPENMVEFVFENGDNTLTNMSKYMSKNNVQLLFVNRERDKTKEAKYKFGNLAKELNCSIMLTH